MSTDMGDAPDINRIGKSRVIKAIDVSLHNHASDVLQRARLQAKALEEQAEEAAQRIVNEAQTRAEQMLDEARAQGQEIANNIIEEEKQTSSRKAADYLINITADLQSQLNRIDHHIIHLVGAALEKIIGEMDGADKIERVVTQGLQELKDQYGLILLVHASEFDAAQVAVSRFHSFVGHEQGPVQRVEIDADLKPGECFILSSGGLLDISIKTQLNAITEGLSNRQKEAHT